MFSKVDFKTRQMQKQLKDNGKLIKELTQMQTDKETYDTLATDVEDQNKVIVKLTKELGLDK